MLDRFNDKKHSVGSLFLTTTHLIFSDNKREIWMLHMHIQVGWWALSLSRSLFLVLGFASAHHRTHGLPWINASFTFQTVEKQALTTNGCPLVIRCKNFLSATFLVPLERQCHDIYVSLLQLSQPGQSIFNVAFSLHVYTQKVVESSRKYSLSLSTLYGTSVEL